MDLAFGKKPAEPSPKDFKLSDVVVALPPLPKKNFGYGTIFKDWGMLGNDYHGDCVFAGADHETMLWNRLALHPVTFDAVDTLQDYADVTGFDPVTGANDNGTYVREALSYRRKTGVVDSAGARHKIDAYVAIDPNDFDLMLRCVFTFGAVGIGFRVPESAMQQFYHGQTWEDIGDTNIVGGHYVCGVGSTMPGKGTFVTWGRRQFMTRGFYQAYNDETWIPLSREQLKSSGYNSRHIDWQVLQGMLDSL